MPRGVRHVTPLTRPFSWPMVGPGKTWSHGGDMENRLSFLRYVLRISFLYVRRSCSSKLLHGCMIPYAYDGKMKPFLPGRARPMAHVAPSR